MRVAERFGTGGLEPQQWFNRLDAPTQDRLLGYELLREAEESSFGCPFVR